MTRPYKFVNCQGLCHSHPYKAISRLVPRRRGKGSGMRTSVHSQAERIWAVVRGASVLRPARGQGRAWSSRAVHPWTPCAGTHMAAWWPETLPGSGAGSTPAGPGSKAAVSPGLWETGARSCGNDGIPGAGQGSGARGPGHMARPLVSRLGLLSLPDGSAGPGSFLEPHLEGQAEGPGGVRGKRDPQYRLCSGRSGGGEAVQLRILLPLSLRPPI